MQQNKYTEVLSQLPDQKAITRPVIEINGKYVKLPFFSAIPQSATDLRLILEEFDPDKLIEDESIGEVDFLNALSYRLFEHDKIVREQSNRIGQLTLDSKISMFRYVQQTKLKLIDPSTELYRHRYKGYLKPYAALKDLPPYFGEYLKKIISRSSLDMNSEHENFWNSLFTSKRKGTKSAHFLRWHWEIQKNRGADIFIPPTPYVSNKFPRLIDRAIEMNYDAHDFIKDEEVSTAFVIDMDLFNDKKAIDKLTNYFDQVPNRITMFKLFEPTKMLRVGFGQYARQNFEFFLRAVLSIKEEQPARVFGLLDGGAFGYSLLGAGFDFFTDTVSNYTPYYVPSKKRATHRGMINAETLSIEKFEGVKNIYAENRVLMHDCKICNKYKGLENIAVVNPKIWSEDCRRHGLHMWNKFTQECFDARRTGQDKLFFDKIQNSDYAVLGTILMNINAK